MNTISTETRDSVAAWLDEIHVPNTYTDQLDLTLIDDRASLANQARREPLISEVAERYVADMERGDVFPPIIVRKHPRGTKYTVLSGNHRVAAARKTGTALAAYVVECSDEIALRIAYEDNRRHGLPPSDEERIDQALHLIDLGWDRAAAAAAVGVGAGKVQRARDVMRTRERAKRLGVTGFDDLAATVRARLANLRSDPAFVAAVELARDAKLSPDHVFPMVTALNNVGSDAEALKLVDAERARYLERIQTRAAGKAPQRQGPSPRAQLLEAVTKIALVDVQDVVRATLPDQRRDLSKRLNQAAVKLIELDKAIRA